MAESQFIRRDGVSIRNLNYHHNLMIALARRANIRMWRYQRLCKIVQSRGRWLIGGEGKTTTSAADQLQPKWKHRLKQH